MSDLKKMIKESGLSMDLVDNVVEFDPACIACTPSCTFGCSRGCWATNAPGVIIIEPKEPVQDIQIA